MSGFIWPYGRGKPYTIYGTTQGDEAEISRLAHQAEKMDIVPRDQFEHDKPQIGTNKVLDLDDCR